MLLALFFRGNEVQRNGVHAVACIFGREHLTREDMPEMSAAVCTDDFGPDTVRIRDPFHGAGNLIIKTRPSAIGFKLVLGSVKRSIASLAGLYAFLFGIDILAGERHFCTFVQDHAFLFGRQFIVGHLFLSGKCRHKKYYKKKQRENA